MVRNAGAVRRHNKTQETLRPVKIKKVDHSALVVSDMERTRWFYGDVLGFSEFPRPDNFTVGGCWFRGAGFELHFIAAADTTTPVSAPAPAISPETMTRLRAASPLSLSGSIAPKRA